MHKKVAILLAIATTTFTIAACSDKLDAGKSCPLLCPEQAITLVLERRDKRRVQAVGPYETALCRAALKAVTP